MHHHHGSLLLPFRSPVSYHQTLCLSKIYNVAFVAILYRPVETSWGKAVRSTCIAALISKSDLSTFTCPSCKQFHQVTESSYPAASNVLIKVLGPFFLMCDVTSCHKVVVLKNLKSHVESGCRLDIPTFSLSELTVGQIISCPLMSPPTTADKKAATNVVKRLCAARSPHQDLHIYNPYFHNVISHPFFNIPLSQVRT